MNMMQFTSCTYKPRTTVAKNEKVFFHGMNFPYKPLLYSNQTYEWLSSESPKLWKVPTYCQSRHVVKDLPYGKEIIFFKGDYKALRLRW